MKKLITKLKCLFGNHDYQVAETKIAKGFLLGGAVEARRYKCKHCPWQDKEWVVTESISISF